MRFDFAAQFTGILLQLTAHRLKGVSDGDVRVLVRGILLRFAMDDQFPLRNGDVNSDMIDVPVPVTPVGLLDHDFATGDSIEQFFQRFDVLANMLLQRFRMIESMKTDLERRLHSSLSRGGA